MPNYAVNCTTESAIYVMELTVIGGVPIKKGGDKIQSFSMSCDLPMIKGTPPGVSSLGSAARNLD